MLKVAVNPRLGLRYLWVNEPTGREEFELAQGDPVALTEALGRLVVSFDKEQFLELSLADRDRILAAVFVHCFGDAVETQLRCAGCGKPYELGFSLGEFTRELDVVPAGLLQPDENGVFSLAAGERFRLPTVQDELLAAGLGPEAAAQLFLRRCLVNGSEGSTGSVDVEAVERHLEALAPLLRTTLGSSCPHCERQQEVEFDLVSYSRRCFQRDRAMLTREIHCLASAYRFGYQEILGMPRNVRQELVALLLGQRQRGVA